jgi:crotonobetaine/carnitine-CoA ligase
MSAVSPFSLPPADRTLRGMFAAAIARNPSRDIFICSDTRWTVDESQSVAQRGAQWLRGLGISRGDRVAVFCGNRPEFLEIVLGCGWLGAIAVPVNTACRTPQLLYYLKDSQARLLVIEEPLLSELPGADSPGLALEAVCVIGRAPGDTASEQAESASLNDAVHSHELSGNIRGWRSVPFSPMVRGAGEGTGLPERSPGPADPWLILYTSGTTGPSKGVLCPHAQLYAWGINAATMLGIRSGDILGTTLPLFHINALSCFTQALVADATLALEPRFSVSNFWTAMIRQQATVGYVLGAMVPMLLANDPSPQERAHTLRIALGPGVPPALAKRFQERTGVFLLEGYGSTETNFVIAALPGTGCEGTMGLIQPGFQARVVDEDDVELPPGTAGELILRASEPFAFSSGYFGRAEQTVQAWRNLWFHTGDRVVQDAQGRFIFMDRMKDAIRRRGENISSFEVEQVLISHPAIANAAVFPVRSELAEDEVMAALILKPDVRFSHAELVAFCAERMPHFAVPRYIDIVTDLPRTENGKVRKVALRERGVGAQTWDRDAAGVAVARRR